MRIHLIAIGGAAMHSLAIALHLKGHIVTGSDDEIFEPARSQLQKYNLLPAEPGWFPGKISSGMDVIILGMHAQRDNPELMKALELGIRINSYPEFLYHETREKTRVVISGSHGKTTITAMVMHVLQYNRIKFDYMVGSRLEGFDNMVRLEKDSGIAIFEGDEYLSSPLDPKPKFHVYEPQLALISGIAWDHINVFPTWEKYVDQFRIFIEKMPADGCLVYCEEDPNLKSLAETTNSNLLKLPYFTHDHKVEGSTTWLLHMKGRTQVQVFGRHNMQNISGARAICNRLGISDDQFYPAISGFKGAGKRLQLLGSNANTHIYLDFAHSPSKVMATVKAVKEQFPNHRLLACLELHTFSSLNKNFLDFYQHSLDSADIPVVYYDPLIIQHKRLENIEPHEVKQAFGIADLFVFTLQVQVEEYLLSQNWKNTNLLLMSSGNFSGMNIRLLSEKILSKK